MSIVVVAISEFHVFFVLIEIVDHSRRVVDCLLLLPAVGEWSERRAKQMIDVSILKTFSSMRTGLRTIVSERC
jgi:hypothetical protein